MLTTRAIESRDVARSRMRGLVAHVGKIVVDAAPVAMHHNHASHPLAASVASSATFCIDTYRANYIILDVRLPLRGVEGQECKPKQTHKYPAASAARL